MDCPFICGSVKPSRSTTWANRMKPWKFPDSGSEIEIPWRRLPRRHGSAYHTISTSDQSRAKEKCSTEVGCLKKWGVFSSPGFKEFRKWSPTNMETLKKTFLDWSFSIIHSSALESIFSTNSDQPLSKCIGTGTSLSLVEMDRSVLRESVTTSHYRQSFIPYRTDMGNCWARRLSWLWMPNLE
jgi:hypothetical protein